MILSALRGKKTNLSLRTSKPGEAIQRRSARDHFAPTSLVMTGIFFVPSAANK